MVVVTTRRRRRKSLRFFALLVVIALTLIAVFFARQPSGQEARTADWVTASFTDFGVSISYPRGLDISSSDNELFSAFNDDMGISVQMLPNSSDETARAWLERVFGGDITDDMVGGQPSAVVEIEDGRRIVVAIINDRVMQLAVRGSEEFKDDVEGLVFLALNQQKSEYSSQSRLLELTDLGFKAVYDAAFLPGTKNITKSPSITGNAKADAHIQDLAEERGYRLQREVSASLDIVDGYSLQQNAAAAWRDLKAAAADDGLGLSVTSGYRSVDSQRGIFISRLAAACAKEYGANCSNADIVSGKADRAIDEVLSTSSIPGYSRHHTGYTVDIGHDGVGAFEDFYGTPGWKWISKNNYENAKRFGFVPSYPPEAGTQGPDPEPWEYVYIGPSYFLVGE